MTFLSTLSAALIEWLLSKVAALGVKEYQEYETEAQAKEKAELDAKALLSAKDVDAQKAALSTIVNDTFGDASNETDSTKPTSH